MTGNLSGNSVHRYSVQVPSDSNLHVFVSALTAKTRLLLRDSGGVTVLDRNVGEGVPGTEWVVDKARSRGNYSLELTTLVPDAPATSFEIAINTVEQRQSVADEMARISADVNSIFASGSKRGDVDRALHHLDDVSTRCERAGATGCRVYTAYAKGLLNLSLRRYPEAQIPFAAALVLVDQRKDRYVAGIILDLLLHSLHMGMQIPDGLLMSEHALQLASVHSSQYLSTRADSWRASFLSSAGRTSEAIERCLLALASARKGGFVPLETEAELDWAELLWAAGRDPLGREASAALAHAHERRDAARESRALTLLGAVRFQLSDLQAALDFANAAEAIYEAGRVPGDPAAHASNLLSLAAVLSFMGQPQQAGAVHERASQLCREANSVRCDMSALRATAKLKLGSEDYEAARTLYGQTLEKSRAFSDVPGEASDLEWLGRISSRLVDVPAAEKFFSEALKLYRQEEDRFHEARILAALGGLERYRKNYDAAMRYYSNALTIRREVGDDFGIATSNATIGAVLRSQGKWDEAVARFEAAVNRG